MLLRKWNIPYDEVRIDLDRVVLREFAEVTHGARTVPQILIDNRCIGGFTELTELHMEGGLDGLMRTTDGAWLVSSWNDSTVRRLMPGDTAWSAVVRGVASPADIGFDTRRQRILIPQFNVNRVRIVPAR